MLFVLNVEYILQFWNRFSNLEGALMCCILTRLITIKIHIQDNYHTKGWRSNHGRMFLSSALKAMDISKDLKFMPHRF